MQKNIALICNPTRQGSKSWGIGKKISSILTQTDTEHTLYISGWPNRWQAFSEVWIIGGDGTLNYFINQNPDLDIPISIFAGGTGNDFHWMLYGKISIEQQVKKLLKHNIQKIDAGNCNGKLFLNGVGIGFDGAVVKDLLGKKKLVGKIVYYATILKNILGYRENQFSIAFENTVIEKKCFLISIANGIRYGGGFKVAPKALLNDGVLDLNMVYAISPLKRIRYLPVIETGKHLDLPFIDYRQIKKVQITTPISVDAHIDGEYFSASSFEINCLPQKFSFLV